MDTRRHFVLSVLTGLVVLALGAFALFRERNPFTGVDVATLMAIVVFVVMIALLLNDIGLRLEMRLPRHFRRLGPGFGLVKALKSMTAKIDAVRDRHSAGELTEAQAAEAESRLFDECSAYFKDKRWKQVEQLKRQGNLEDGKALANRIREDHGL
jgi:hypothetical protein